MVWRLHNPFNPIVNWPNIVRELITIQSLSFALSAIWLYVLCARMIVIYHLNIADQLKQLHVVGRHFSLDEILLAVKTFKYLSHATYLLHRHFGLILLINCCYLVVNLIQILYYITRFGSLMTTILTVWDCFTLFEVISRLFLICHTADSIRTSVSY